MISATRHARMGPVRSWIALATVLAGVPGAPAMAQPCNPVIDGTYCAEESEAQVGFSGHPAAHSERCEASLAP